LELCDESVARTVPSQYNPERRETSNKEIQPLLRHVHGCRGISRSRRRPGSIPGVSESSASVRLGINKCYGSGGFPRSCPLPRPHPTCAHCQPPAGLSSHPWVAVRVRADDPSAASTNEVFHVVIVAFLDTDEYKGEFPFVPAHRAPALRIAAEQHLAAMIQHHWATPAQPRPARRAAAAACRSGTAPAPGSPVAALTVTQ
jgi:hypothetical protein